MSVAKSKQSCVAHCAKREYVMKHTFWDLFKSRCRCGHNCGVEFISHDQRFVTIDGLGDFAAGQLRPRLDYKVELLNIRRSTMSARLILRKISTCVGFFCGDVVGC